MGRGCFIRRSEDKRFDLEVGAQVGPRRAPRLGRGGLASVFVTHEASIERDVILKALPAEFLHDPTFAARDRISLTRT